MSITKSIGYDGSVGESEHASLMQVVGSQNYGVCGASDWGVTIDSGRSLGTVVGSGWGYGWGILDYNDAGVALSHETASGTRYDTVVARRDSSQNKTTFAIIKGGASATVASLARTPGGISEQPLALVQVNSSAVTAVISLRTWQEKITTCENIQSLPFPWPGAVAHVGPASTVQRQEYRVRNVSGALQWVQVQSSGAFLGQYGGAFTALSPEGGTSVRRVWGLDGEILASVTIPDFGRPVEVEARFNAEMGTSRPDGLRWDVHLNVDSAQGVNLGFIEGMTGLGRSIAWYDSHPLPAILGAGSHTIFAVARGTVSDGGNFGYGIITPYNRALTVNVKAA